MREVIGELRAWMAWAQESGLSNLAQAAAAPPPQAQEAPLKLNLLDPVREELGECTRCKLHKGRKNIVFGVGNPRARLMFVGEAPGEDEDIQGFPFVGKAGQLLTKGKDRKSTRLNSSHMSISYAVFCLKKKNTAARASELMKTSMTESSRRGGG